MQLSIPNPSTRPAAYNAAVWKKWMSYMVLGIVVALGFATSAGAVDLETFAGITGPLTTALTQIALLTPGFKAIVGLVGFLVAFIALAGLRNFGPVIFYLGMAIFGAVGLAVAGAIMGAVV
jgi:RsiW-degrading membrane proteinase PrsW (M82 family)